MFINLSLLGCLLFIRKQWFCSLNQVRPVFAC
nr:MAG TPA: hypothetical protein [Caudoviricetes sp.]